MPTHRQAECCLKECEGTVILKEWQDRESALHDPSLTDAYRKVKITKCVAHYFLTKRFRKSSFTKVFIFEGSIA